ncbi:CUB and sushi domain-containing protein 1-like isoform X3 [Dysidea avara]|uniref:CUB and sushi domain-containing protein 1-like isoform X3 n=1 Tax=Dysidea avara TaxID=196820 RepID=UPI00332A6653
MILTTQKRIFIPEIVIFSALLIHCAIITGGQNCIDNPDVSQIGTVLVPSGRQVVVPNVRLNCTVRVTHIAASLGFGDLGSNQPIIQMWRPSSPGSTVYNRIAQVQTTGEITIDFNHFFFNLSIPNSSDFEFLPGDVIGYYQPSSPRRRIWSIPTSGYTSYSNNANGPTTTIDISNVDNVEPSRQPLIELSFDESCDNLTSPSNGEITSCSSGGIGVGYEGDTCSFTCNTGYELTVSDTRTCQSDGSWSGSDAMCRRAPCSSLTDPNNGVITCSLRDDGVPSYEDTCSFTCNTGYELFGSDTRTCQSNGSWSGSDAVCRRVSCPSLNDPNNGTISCSLGDDGVPSYEDTCSFTCNTGYELTGSDTRTCQSDRSWSGSETMCIRVPCPLLTDPNNGVMTCSLVEDRVSSSYKDTCSFTCNTGYELTGSDTRTCQNNGSWSGTEAMCIRVPCPSLTEPNNGALNCSLGDDGVPSYEDTCSFTCNTGYELTGSSTRTCQSDGSWSSSDIFCKGDTVKNMKDEQYSEVVAESYCDNTITENSNPSHQSYTRQGCNVAIQPNPSYGVNQLNSKTITDQYEYTEPLDAPLTKAVNMEHNPSYGIAARRGADTETTDTPNPYGVTKADTQMINQCDHLYS